MHLFTKGDSSDVFDSDFPHPKSEAVWHSTQRKEYNEDSEEFIWILESQGLLQGKTIFTKDSFDIGSTRHPITVKKKENWISTIYTVEQVFEGREVYRKYPKFGDTVLNEEKSDSIQWLPEALVYVCSQALNSIRQDSSSQIDSALMERLNHHLKNYFIHVETTRLLEELEQERLEMLKTALSPFLQQLPGGFIQKMSTAMKPFEKEIRVTTGLKDDHFQFLLFMPGIISNTNADTIAGDTMKWEFGLADFLNDDKIIYSKSIVYSKSKIQKIMLFSALVMCILLFIFWRKTKHETV